MTFLRGNHYKSLWGGALRLRAEGCWWVGYSLLLLIAVAGCDDPSASRLSAEEQLYREILQEQKAKAMAIKKGLSLDGRMLPLPEVQDTFPAIDWVRPMLVFRYDKYRHCNKCVQMVLEKLNELYQEYPALEERVVVLINPIPPNEWLAFVKTHDYATPNLYAVKNEEWPHLPAMKDLLGGSPFFVTLEAKHEARDGFYPEWDRPGEAEAYLQAWINRYL